MIKLLVIGAMASILVALILGRKYKLLFWVMVAAMVIGGRDVHFTYQDLNFQLPAFTVILLSVTFLTIPLIGKTLSIGEKVGVGLLFFSMVFGLVNDVQPDQCILWIVPPLSIFLYKHCCTVFVRSEADNIRAQRIFVWISFVIALGSLLAVAGFRLGGLLLKPGIYGTQTGQHLVNSSGFWTSNTIAGITVISLLFVPTLPYPIWVKAMLAAAQVGQVIFSGKRLAVISLVLAGVFMVFGMKDKRRRFQTFLMALLVGVLGYVFMPAGMKARFVQAQEAVQGTEGRVDPRIARINAALARIKEDPVLGGGAGDSVFIHNAYLEMVADMGLFALPLFYLFIEPMYKSWRFGRTSRVWMQCLLIFMLSPFLFESVLNWPEQLAFMGFFYGMLRVTLGWDRAALEGAARARRDATRRPRGRTLPAGQRSESLSS